LKTGRIGMDKVSGEIRLDPDLKAHPIGHILKTA
jgi:hypothetical protein